MTPVEQLQTAGFSDDEIGQWSQQQRQTLTQAGFGDDEIDGYLVGPKPPMGGFLKRIAASADFLRSGDPEAAGAAAVSSAMRPATQPFVDLAKNLTGTLVIDPIVGAYETMDQVLSGKGFTPEEALNYTALAVRGPPITRVRPKPGGGIDAFPIGSLPKNSDFGDAARVTMGAPRPDVEAKVKTLWDEHGIHPAEVTHDAQSDVTITQDLASSTDRLPERYVRPPQGHTAPETPAEPAQAPEAVPAPEPAATPEPTTPAPAAEAAAAPTTAAEPAAAAEPAKTLAADAAHERLMAKEGGYIGDRPPPPPERPEGPPESVPEAEGRILSRLSIGETDAGSKWSWSKLYSAVVDRLNPINDAVQEAGGKGLAVAEDPYKLARLYAGVSGKADHFLNYGTFDFDTYSPTGKSLKDVLAPVDDLNQFRAFATSLRAVELEGRGIKTGVDLDAARMVAKAGEERYAPVMAELVAYQNRLAGYLRESGVLSREGYAAMREANPLYVPFQRVFGDVVGDVIPDAIRGQGGTLQASDPIHGIVGSERRVIDPIESIVRNTYLSVMMAERNAIGTKLVDMLDRAGDMPAPARTDTISIYRNGVKETHKVNAELAAAVKGLDEEASNTMLRLLGAPARMLRAGATLSPDFLLRNPIRDFFGAVVNTTKGAFSPIDTAKGLMSAIRRDGEFREWLKGGGANAAMVSLDRRYLQQNLEKLTEQTGLGSRSWNVIRHPIDTLRTLSQISEEATRLGEFRAVRERELAAGAAPKEAAQGAAYASREVTLDFARRGAMTRSMNMITAFWNAQVQGVDRLARAFGDDPAGTGLKIAAGITMPSVLLWWANHDDPRWKEIPDWERDLFWLVMTGKGTPDDPGHIFRIPKPFEVGVMFGSGPERLLDAYFDQKPDAFHDFTKSIMSALLPGVVPTFAGPIVEQWANRSTFTDRPLIPADLEKQLPEYQYTPYTTETAKKLGQIIGAFPGIRAAGAGDNGGVLGGSFGGVARSLSSPILMENYVRAWTGSLGMYALQTADAGLRKAGAVPDPVKPDDTLADIPVVKAFVVRYPSAGAESIQRFYDEYGSNKKYFDTLMAKAKEGDVTAVERIRDAGGDQIFVQLDPIKQALGQLSQIARDIYKNPDIDGGQKRQLIDQLYYGQIQIAQRGLEGFATARKALSP